MAPSRSEVKLCDVTTCGRWWANADFENPSSLSFRRCPYCRGAEIIATKYWLGGYAGPKDPPYNFSGCSPFQTARQSEERQTSKRTSPISSPLDTKRPDKIRKIQQPSPISPIGDFEIATADRRDSTPSMPPSPLSALPTKEPTFQAIVQKASSLYEALKKCNGSPKAHKATELAAARATIGSIQIDIINIEAKLVECRSLLVEAEAEMAKREVYWEAVTSAAWVADIDGWDKDNPWLQGAQKPVQRAFEDRKRKQEHVTAAEDELEQAQRRLAVENKRVDDILEEIPDLVKFRELFGKELSSTTGRDRSRPGSLSSTEG